jgi:hypothetical protein
MRRRSETDWAEVPYPVTVTGHAEVGPVNGNDQPAGVLWVPDPEQRRGWREVYIDKPGSKAERGVGFIKPGAR